jgi:hypothetical protein
MRLLLRKPKEQYFMIIRCHHLREAGIMNECCSHCHVLAGCVIRMLPNDHQAIFCCGHIGPFTPEQIETILAKIPAWEVQEKFPSLQKEDDHIGASGLRVEGSPSSTVPPIPERFRPAYQAIQRLERHERYLAALIFGSVARGEATEHSDLDVEVIVNESKPRHNINHPIIGCITLNLISLSLEQFQERIRKGIERRGHIRPLPIAESMIVFDKTGTLRRMQEGAQELPPGKVSPREQRRIQQQCLVYNDRIAYHLEKDALTALLLMHEGLIILLMSHYQLHQRWWVSTHHLFSDLPNWDPELAQLVENCVATSEGDAKFQWWSAIINHILQPLGGRESISERNCMCSSCQSDVSMLLEHQERNQAAF